MTVKGLGGQRHAVDLCLRDIMDNDKPFGGKLVVCGGDFRQTLSVVEGGNRAHEVEAQRQETLQEYFGYEL